MSHFGVVYKWMNDKNYGFIREEGRQQDVFLHSSVIRGGQLPMGGEAAYFDVQIDHERGRPRAVNVMLQHHGGMANPGGNGGHRYYQGAGGGGGGGGGGNMGGQSGGHRHYNKPPGAGPGRPFHGEQGLSAREEEQLLIDFGELLRSGNEDAKALHTKYSDNLTRFNEAVTHFMQTRDSGLKTDDTSGALHPVAPQAAAGASAGADGAVEKAAASGDAASGAAGAAAGGKGAGRKGKQEEHLLIAFGRMLQEGDEEAKKIHEKYGKDDDYDAFIEGVNKVLR